MSPILLLGCAVAIAATVVPGPALPSPVLPAARTSVQGPANDPAAQPAKGHVVFVIEGDVRALRITAAVPKDAPWAGVPKGLVSEFALVAHDAAGNELQRVPIDLSKFETDPAKVGQPDKVEGCEVRSSRIGVLLNAPRLPAAATYTILRGKTVLGTATAAAVAELMREVR
ncbi:MAG: hypothetical protein AB7O97_02380 [Planctomycetota bacterium]